MTEYIHEHGVEKNEGPPPNSRVTEYICPSEDCYIRARGTKAWNSFVELAKEFPCPSGSTDCIVCGRSIEPWGDICRVCENDLVVGQIVDYEDDD